MTHAGEKPGHAGRKPGRGEGASGDAGQPRGHGDHASGRHAHASGHGGHVHGGHAPEKKNDGRATTRSLGSWIVDALSKRRHAAVLRHVQGRLLDIGCGENRLVRSHGTGVGVDVIQWGDVDIVVENTARLPVESGTFDTVTFIACLNHIPNREEVVAEARRVIKDDGRLIATMIPPRLSTIWHAIIRPWDPDQHGRHLHDGEVWGLTNREMRDLITRQGFEVVRHERFVFGLNNLFVAVPRKR